MNLRGLIMVSLSVKFVYSATDPPNICTNNETKEVECCNDFKNISGICKACIGTFGKNCLNNCLYGFYGHGCRNKCDCDTQQICDRRQGCITATLVKNVGTNFTIIYIVPSMVCFLIILGCSLLCCRTCNQNINTTGRTAVCQAKDPVKEIVTGPDRQNSTYIEMTESGLQDVTSNFVRSATSNYTIPTNVYMALKPNK